MAHFDLTLPKEVLVDPQIFTVQTIDLCSRQVRYYQRYYLNMDRYAFDRWLLSLVPSQAEILPGRCTAVARREDSFSLTVRTDGKERHFTARRVVGADGASSLVRRTFYREPKTRYTAIQQWFPAGENRAPFYSCIFDPVTSESCSWIIRKDDTLIFGGCFSPQDSREAYNRQKSRLEEYLGHSLGRPIKTEACQAVRPRGFSGFYHWPGWRISYWGSGGLYQRQLLRRNSSAIRSGSALAEAMSQAVMTANLPRFYRRKTTSLRLKLWLKTIKRWFMYTPWVRHIIMRLGLAAIHVEQENK